MTPREATTKVMRRVFENLNRESEILGQNVSERIINDLNAFTEMHGAEAYFLVTRDENRGDTIIIEDDILSEDDAKDMFAAIVMDYVRMQICDEDIVNDNKRYVEAIKQRVTEFMKEVEKKAIDYADIYDGTTEISDELR